MEMVPAKAVNPDHARMEEWWRPIPRTPTTETYITGPAALNIPHAGVWGGWQGWMWHIRIAGEGEQIERANETRMGRSKEWPYWDEIEPARCERRTSNNRASCGKTQRASLRGKIRESRRRMGGKDGNSAERRVSISTTERDHHLAENRGAARRTRRLAHKSGKSTGGSQ